MRTQSRRMAHLVAKVSAAAAIALALTMFATTLPQASAGLSPADEPAPGDVKAKRCRKRRAFKAGAGQGRAAPQRFSGVPGIYTDRADVFQDDLSDRH